MAAPTLAELQRGFFRSIAAQPGAGPSAFDPAVVEVIDPSRTLAPAERLDIYADMYFARLKDCLAEDFARTVELLGAPGWDAVARGYFAAHPSHHPSVRHAGAHLPAYLAGCPGTDLPPALSELARFEWARLDVFDAPDAVPLSGAGLAAVPPDQWGTLRFGPVPAFAVFESDWPIDRIWGGDAALDAPPAACTLRIWRKGFMVYHAPMSAPEANAMRHLMAGAPFAGVCEAIAAGISLEEAAPKAVAWLARWVEDGVLAAPRVL